MVTSSPCSSLEVSEEVRQYLKTPTFDNWWVKPEHQDPKGGGDVLTSPAAPLFITVRCRPSVHRREHRQTTGAPVSPVYRRWGRWSANGGRGQPAPLTHFEWGSEPSPFSLTHISTLISIWMGPWSARKSKEGLHKRLNQPTPFEVGFKERECTLHSLGLVQRFICPIHLLLNQTHDDGGG